MTVHRFVANPSGCRPPWAPLAAVAALWLALAGCAASPPEWQRSRQLAAEGRNEEALQVLEQAQQREPDNVALRAAAVRQRESTLARWLLAADAAAAARRDDEAGAMYDKVLAREPGNARAVAGQAALRQRKDGDARFARAETLLQNGQAAEAEGALREVLLHEPTHRGAQRALARLRERSLAADLVPPVLKGALAQTISLELRDTPLRNAFEVIGRTAPLNFVFDRDVRTDARVNLSVRNSPVHDVIRLLLATQQLERKVLNDNSLLVYPATQAKQREYQDQATRVFFLTNADVKQAQGLLRSMAKIRELHADEKLNMVAVRDTPEAVRLAERLIESIDIAEPEVMLEVEVLEVSRSRALNLGVQFPEQVSLENRLPLSGSVPTGRVDLSHSSLAATVANPALRIGLLSQDTDVNLLANPRIRARSRDKARILIGEKLPVFTTTAVQNAGVASSVSYLDVGLKLEVEPTVYLDDEVGIKVLLEVNSNLERITAADGSTAFRLGTRTAQTSLRLRDGETQVLAGLINDNERDTFSKLPGLGDLPGVGRAFGNTTRSKDKNEIVLLITPRILRNIQPPTAAALMMASGTEAAIGAAPLVIAPTAPRSLSLSTPQAGAPRNAEPPAAAASAAAAQGTATAAEGPAAAGAPVVRLIAPAEVSIGRDFTVQVEVVSGGSARQGEAVLVFDASLIGGAGPGRLTVPLVPSGPGTLVGQVSLRAQAAGTGNTVLQVQGGTLQPGDGPVRAFGSAQAVLRIGL